MDEPVFYINRCAFELTFRVRLFPLRSAAYFVDYCHRNVFLRKNGSKDRNMLYFTCAHPARKSRTWLGCQRASKGIYSYLTNFLTPIADVESQAGLDRN